MATSWRVPQRQPLPPPLLQQRRGQTRRHACEPRNVYLDVGVNWCNTLTLYEECPEAQQWALPNVPWMTWGFEAAPLIMPFADRCATALSAGEALPMPPVPPAGSTMELSKFFKRTLNCVEPCVEARTPWECERQCVFDKLARRLRQLRPDPNLMQNRMLVQERLALATNCRRSPTVSLIPAAASNQDGNISVSFGSDPKQMLIGGVAAITANYTAKSSKTADVMAVDFVRWFEAAFATQDFVVLKLDIEGAEAYIVEGLLKAGIANRIDILLWECHW